MARIFLSIVILIVAIVIAVLLYSLVLGNDYDVMSFPNLVWMGLITFGLGVLIFISANLLLLQIRDNRG